ncbi:MAG: methylmalonyl-CoA mutase family protein [Saprospiraceae bacterium]
MNSVRGTVQADILKEDQAQNTCIFSTEFSLKLMGDVQQYFIDHNVRNFYWFLFPVTILQRRVPIRLPSWHLH